MTPLQKPFKEKCVSAAEALKVVQSMNQVVIGHAAGEPKVLVEELMRQSVRLVGVEVMHMLPLYSCEYAKPEHSRSFRHNALFGGGEPRGNQLGTCRLHTLLFFGDPASVPRWNTPGRCGTDPTVAS